MVLGRFHGSTFLSSGHVLLGGFTQIPRPFESPQLLELYNSCESDISDDRHTPRVEGKTMDTGVDEVKDG
jgi:hypothetical protein